MRLPVSVGAIGLAMLLGGCAAPAAGSHPQEIDCGGVPDGACTEQADRLAQQAGGSARTVSLTCRLAACTRAAGAGTATITRADGSSVVLAWSYSGDPGPQPVPVCVGLAHDVCLARVAENIGNVSPTRHIVAIDVTCTTHCDDAGGDATLVFRAADGNTDQMTTSWGGGTPR